MVILLTGDNSFQADQEVRRLADSLVVQPERVEIETLTLNALADVMKGVSLFAEKRLVVVTGLSAKSELWNQAAEWAGEMSDDTTLVLREVKPDRRTKAYKLLAKTATVIEVTSWTERQHALAEKWLAVYAKQLGVNISHDQVRDMVARALVPSERPGYRVVDQSLVARALDALKDLESITTATIDAVMPPSTDEALFDLLETAALRQSAKLQTQLDALKVSQDPYYLMAIVVSQWSQLVLVAYGDPADTTDIHPFVRQKFSGLSREFSRAQFHDLTELLARLDTDTKSTSTTPWEALTLFLFYVANR